MGRVRVFIVLALAVTAGGVFAFGTYNYVQKMQPKGGPNLPTRPVVIAATDLDVGTEITAENVRVIAWPQDSVPPQAISDPQEVMGRGIITPVVQNEPIFAVKL